MIFVNNKASLSPCHPFYLSFYEPRKNNDAQKIMTLLFITTVTFVNTALYPNYC